MPDRCRPHHIHLGYRRSGMSHPTDFRETLQAALLCRPAAAAAKTDPLRPLLASLLCGRALGLGVLNAQLGLPADAAATLWADYFPGAPLPLQDGPGIPEAEHDDLLQLLLEYRAGAQASVLWLAHCVAYACCGRDHLWQDLGLAHRGELSQLMTLAFPA